MPIKAERNLKKEARKKGLTGDRYKAYVYGTLDKIKKKQAGKKAAPKRKKKK